MLIVNTVKYMTVIKWLLCGVAIRPYSNYCKGAYYTHTIGRLQQSKGIKRSIYMGKNDSKAGFHMGENTQDPPLSRKVLC